MADFRDLADSSASKWADILHSSGVEFDVKSFPFGYFQQTAKQFGLADNYLDLLASEDPRKANVCLMYYALYPLMKGQTATFFSDQELNVEFSNLISSARNHQIKLEV